MIADRSTESRFFLIEKMYVPVHNNTNVKLNPWDQTFKTGYSKKSSVLFFGFDISCQFLKNPLLLTSLREDLLLELLLLTLSIAIFHLKKGEGNKSFLAKQFL